MCTWNYQYWLDSLSLGRLFGIVRVIHHIAIHICDTNLFLPMRESSPELTLLLFFLYYFFFLLPGFRA